MFEGLADKAAESVENTESPQTDKAQSEPLSAAPSEAPKETPSEALDLAKAKEFIFEGQKMTYEDLKKAYMRHSDYTKKSMAMAEERKTLESYNQEKKYLDNLRFDLATVRKNPEMAAEFRKHYPAKFHSYLEAVLDNVPQVPTLPPEVMQKLEKIDQHDEALKSFQEDRQRVEKEQIISQLESWETKFLKKYPSAEVGLVYQTLDAHTAKMREDDPDFTFKALDEKVVEAVYKSVHDHFEKKFEARERERLTKIREANHAGSDIPPGGSSTAGPAPQKMRLKDVGDHMIASLNQG